MIDYKDPRWQKFRLWVFNRDNFQCVKCGESGRTLHVHHKYYVKGRKPWHYPGWALDTLCDDCHEYTHSQIIDDDSRMDLWESAILQLKSRDFVLISMVLSEINLLQEKGVSKPDIWHAIKSLKEQDLSEQPTENQP